MVGVAQPRLAPARLTIHRGVQRARARDQPRLPVGARAVGARLQPARASAGIDANDADNSVYSFARCNADGRAHARVRRQPHAGAAHRLSASTCRAGRWESRAQHRRPPRSVARAGDGRSPATVIEGPWPSTSRRSPSSGFAPADSIPGGWRPRLVVHGHFYQPPRENPWTEEVRASRRPGRSTTGTTASPPSATGPTASPAVIDERGRVVAIVNNYAHLSLRRRSDAAVVARSAPARRLRPDGRRRPRGRGAIAHPWIHMILPLRHRRDARLKCDGGWPTSEHRFGREPEGIWLPETAVDDAMLQLLAEEGVAFTILRPSQADRLIDRTRSVPLVRRGRRRSSSTTGRSRTTSRSAPPSSQVLVDRVAAAAPTAGWCASRPTARRSATTTSSPTAAWRTRSTVEAPRRGLARRRPRPATCDEHPPIETCGVSSSAWSCAHGVGRWQEDCGCSTGGEPGWNQRWRGPLRRALDVLRDATHEVFDRRGRRVPA